MQVPFEPGESELLIHLSEKYLSNPNAGDKGNRDLVRAALRDFKDPNRSTYPYLETRILSLLKLNSIFNVRKIKKLPLSLGVSCDMTPDLWLAYYTEIAAYIQEFSQIDGIGNDTEEETKNLECLITAAPKRFQRPVDLYFCGSILSPRFYSIH